MRTTAEVTLRLGQKTIEIELRNGGKVIDTEVFAGKARRDDLKELARVLFDDAYDMVNYTLHGMEQR